MLAVQCGLRTHSQLRRAQPATYSPLPIHFQTGISTTHSRQRLLAFRMRPAEVGSGSCGG